MNILISSLKNTYNNLQQNNSLVSLDDFIKTNLYKDYGIKSHSLNNKHILYYDKTVKLDIQNEFITSCNGIIFDSNWNIICVPSYNFNKNVKIGTINENIKKNLYYIYPANDGTTVNLYWDEIKNKWFISSTKGIEMDNVIFNSMTYREMINESYNYSVNNQIISFTENELDLELSNEDFEKLQNEKNNKMINFWSLLDKKYCYTIGFRHPDSHIFTCDGINEYDIWFIQSVNLKIYNSKNAQKCNFGICEINSNLKIRNQKDLSDKFNTVNDLLSFCNKSYENFILEKRFPIFGFILRSTDFNITKSNSCIFIESNLMNKIRNTVYNIPKELKTIFNTYTGNKMNYIMLYKYLSYNYNDKTISTLFPQYKNLFDKFNLTINIICNELINDNVIKVKINPIYQNILETIKNDIINSPFNISFNVKYIPVIRNFIHNSKYTSLFISIL